MEKFKWNKMNGIELFTKEWFVVLVTLSFIGVIIVGLIYDKIL